MKPTPLAIALAVCLLAPAVTRAEAPNRTYQVSFPTSLSLVDPSGDYSEELDGISLDLTLAADLAGKITGTGVARGSTYGVSIRVSLTCTGSISGKPTTPRMALTLVGSGSASAQGMSFPVTLAMNFSGTYSPASGQFIGSAKTKACVTVERKKQCESSSEPTYFEPEQGVVSPILTVALATDAKNKTTGTGTVSLSNGRSFHNWKATGKYTAKTGASQITLSAPDRSGAKLAFTGQATPSGTIQNTTKGSGKLLGQSLKW